MTFIAIMYFLNIGWRYKIHSQQRRPILPKLNMQPCFPSASAQPTTLLLCPLHPTGSDWALASPSPSINTNTYYLFIKCLKLQNNILCFSDCALILHLQRFRKKALLIIQGIFLEDSMLSFTLLCPSSCAQSLCKDLISKLKDLRTTGQLSNKND